jgi:hypothetical protein
MTDSAHRRRGRGEPVRPSTVDEQDDRELTTVHDDLAPEALSSRRRHALLRARARAALVNSYLDQELASLRCLTSKARSAVSRLTWREAMRARCTRIRTALRWVPRFVRATRVTRVKRNGEWFISVEEATASTFVMILDARTTARTLTDLADPPVVHVLRRDLVDVARLELLESARLVRIVMMEAS